MTNGKIIVLNGTSSSGKSSTAKALQNLLDEPYLHMGIDTFIFMLPKRYLNPPLWSEIFEYVWKDGQIEAIKAGARGHQLVSAMHHSLRTLAQLGLNIVVDHVLLERAWVNECAALFDSVEAWSVGIKCPLEVLEQRERERKDRTLGQARAQYNVVHAHCIYDFEVDTSQGTPEICAQQIIQQLAHQAVPTAFQQIRQSQTGN
jgi:chloramphenicol 3-O phosphotransferase